jgi:hypothetical protein
MPDRQPLSRKCSRPHLQVLNPCPFCRSSYSSHLINIHHSISLTYATTYSRCRHLDDADSEPDLGYQYPPQALAHPSPPAPARRKRCARGTDPPAPPPLRRRLVSVSLDLPLESSKGIADADLLPLLDRCALPLFYLAQPSSFICDSTALLD